MDQPSRRPGPLARERARKRTLLTQLDRLGWSRRGSLLQVGNRCGTPGCQCKADPPQLHGPYWQWTRKVSGKTVTVRLSAAQATLVRRWLHNAKRLDHLLAELDQLSDAVTRRLLAAARPHPPPAASRAPHRSSAGARKTPAT